MTIHALRFPAGRLLHVSIAPPVVEAANEVDDSYRSSFIPTFGRLHGIWKAASRYRTDRETDMRLSVRFAP